MSLRKLSMLAARYCFLLFLVAVPVQAFTGFLPSGVTYTPFVLAFALTTVLGATARPAPRPCGSGGPKEVEPPVTGRWQAQNSPADKVPSHGIHAYGQTYAIDITAKPNGCARPTLRWWPVFRRSGSFPSYGQPVLAAADATVVRTAGRQRDHLSRDSVPGRFYLLAEGVLRDLSGPRRLVGNHVVLDLGDGRYAMYAHLGRGSLVVRVGDRVRAGQLLARCGNSGNTSEPHVHFQLMDGPDLDTARGLPFRWRGVGVPGASAPFTAETPVSLAKAEALMEDADSTADHFPLRA